MYWYVWSPHFIKYINSIENVQHFTKRISSITNLPYLEWLAVMDLEPLELRRIKTDLMMYFIKIYNNLSALPSDYLPCDNSVEMWVHYTAVLSYPTVCKWLFNRCVSCFNGSSSKTIAEFKHRLSEVDLSSILMYNFNNSTGYMYVVMLITLYIP